MLRTAVAWRNQYEIHVIRVLFYSWSGKTERVWWYGRKVAGRSVLHLLAI